MKQALHLVRKGRPVRDEATLLGRVGQLAWLCLTLVLLLLGANGGLAQENQTFRLLTFAAPGSGPRLGATHGDGQNEIVDVHNAVRYLFAAQPDTAADLPYVPADMRSLIEAGGPSMAAVKRVYQAITGLRTSGDFSEPGGEGRVFHPPTSVTWLPPIPNPSKILGLAGSYPREGDPPEYPSAFLKSVSALIGHGEGINLAGLVTTGVHEPELAFVIGKKARNVPETSAFDYIVGYTILNDVTARDLPQGNHPAQGSAMRKGLDTFAPCGPYLTLKEDVPNPHNLALGARLNGQDWDIPNANTKYLTFKIPQILAYLSQRMTLLPGDIVATGVPAPVVPLRAGDTAEIIVEGLGTLRNRVLANQ